LTVSGSTFSRNAAGGNGGAGPKSGRGYGGAIYLGESAASASVSGTAFAGNTVGGDGGEGRFSGAGDGGAIAGEGGTGPLTVTASAFTGNGAGGQHGNGLRSGSGSGGAIRSLESLTITDSTFSGNAAGGQGSAGFGGAVTSLGDVGPLAITGSTFTGNDAGGQGGFGRGGAIEVSSTSGQSASITDSTLVGNAAGGGSGSGYGGAIDAFEMSSLILSSVTISSNEVGVGGAGAGINSAISAMSLAGAVTARATIVSGNTGAANCDAPAVATSYSLEGPTSGDTSCGFDLPSADPHLEPLADNGGSTETQALPAASPAVDVVPVAVCPTSVDQRGEPRPDYGEPFCDAGAFELQSPPPPPAGSESPRGSGAPPPKAVEFSLRVEQEALRKLLRTGKLVIVARVGGAARMALTGRAKVSVKNGRSGRARFVTIFEPKIVSFARSGKKRVALALSPGGRDELRHLSRLRVLIVGEVTDATEDTRGKRVALTLR
jgi:hypothetical protein